MIDKVWSLRVLSAAFAKVKANDGAAGVDHQTIAMFAKELDANLQRLHDELRTGSYCPRAVRRVWIPKPGTKEKRPLGVPTVRDRVVQTALRVVLEPIFDWTTFGRLDGWIRMRLRSILRKRQGRRGRGRGADHQRWPNAFFTEQGLFFMAAAHASARQSARR